MIVRRKEEVLFIFIGFCLLWCQVESFSGCKNLSVRVTANNGSQLNLSLIEFIKEAKKNSSVLRETTTTANTTIQKRALMVMGLNQNDKNVVVNYLNEIPMVCKFYRTAWQIDQRDLKQTLNGTFQIYLKGHKVGILFCRLILNKFASNFEMSYSLFLGLVSFGVHAKRKRIHFH
jgi:hypothetical protein